MGGRAPINVWVCGTPSMNQTFEIAFKKLHKEGKVAEMTNLRVI